MKKASIVLLLILFRLFNLSAVQTNSDTLTINAYKTGSSSNTESLILKVYDAVTGSLNSITETDNRIIKIDNYISGTEDSHNNKLLGNVNNDEQGKLIFAIHAEGNTTGSYTVTVEMSPLAYTNNGKFELDKRIPFYFHSMTNLAYFKKSESKTVEHEGYTYTIAEDTSSVTNKSIVNGEVEGSITFKWNVSSELTSTTTMASPSNITGNDVWVYRGGIGMVISKEDYEKAPNGNYRTDVKVTLGVN